MKKMLILLSIFLSGTLFLSALTFGQSKKEIPEEKYKQQEKLKRIKEEVESKLLAERHYQEALKRRQLQITKEMKKDHPGLYRTLEKLKEEQAENYRKAYREFAEQYEQMAKLRNKNPELLNIQMKVHEVQIKLDMVAAKYKKVEEKKVRSKLKDEMKSLLNELFDLKVKKRELEIVSLDKEIDQLRNELQEIRKNKDESIKLKLKQLTQTDVFAW